MSNEPETIIDCRHQMTLRMGMMGMTWDDPNPTTRSACGQ